MEDRLFFHCFEVLPPRIDVNPRRFIEKTVEMEAYMMSVVDAGLIERVTRRLCQCWRVD